MAGGFGLKSKKAPKVKNRAKFLKKHSVKTLKQQIVASDK